MKLDQATGLCGGIVVWSSPNCPLAISFLKLGIYPSDTNFRISPGSIPSMPRIKTLLAILELLKYGARRGAGGTSFFISTGTADSAAIPAAHFVDPPRNALRDIPSLEMSVAIVWLSVFVVGDVTDDNDGFFAIIRYPAI